MVLVYDPISIVNLVLCIAIVVLGLLGYRRKNSTVALYIGIAFALFGISHLVTLLGYRDLLEPGLIWIRTLAYMIIGFALMTILVR